MFQKKKNFKELLKNYNKTEEDYVVELNLIKEKIEMKLDQFILLQNNLRIKGSFIEQLESKKIC